MRPNPVVEVDWEAVWAPYDEGAYRAVLDGLKPPDVVLDIGAGDLRLARRMARIVRQVHAIEIQPDLVDKALLEGGPLPDNLVVVRADARGFPFPAGITVGVLLMRHCTHFQLYAEKLKTAGGRRLITNARWRLGVEVIQLDTPAETYEQAEMGWYMCWCGASGFKPGPLERLTPELERTIHEVVGCPHCNII
jgi:SAM-dependent methyltransferase